MNQLTIFRFTKDSIGAPVRRLGPDRSAVCVAALVVRHGDTSWCLIADHPKNDAVSVTNGYLEFAQAVCQALSCTTAEMAWFELDSCGEFDQVHLVGRSVAFHPVRMVDHPIRSAQAFKARVLPWSGELGVLAEQELSALLAPFAKAPA